MNRLQNIPLKGNVLFLCSGFLPAADMDTRLYKANAAVKKGEYYEKREEKNAKSPR